MKQTHERIELGIFQQAEGHLFRWRNQVCWGH
jgi:hypothetical protein